MKVLVVSGFLGAGKTTFIQELARRTGRDFVVYENEYGQADIDAALLAQDDALSVWEATENCICCTGKQDFALSVLTIANSLDPEYLVVEPTGVARLSSVLESVARVSYERIELLEPVTIVDAGAWRRELELSREIFIDQVRAARTVVVSKTGRLMGGELEELRAWLAGQNPGACVVARPYGELETSWFEGLLAGPEAERPAAGSDGARGASASEEGFESLSLAGAALPTESHFIWLLDAVVAGVFGQVARAKGTVRCAGRLLRFDVVDRAWSLTGAEAAGDEEQPTAVFIGVGLKRMWLREAFQPLMQREDDPGASAPGTPAPGTPAKKYHLGLRA